MLPRILTRVVDWVRAHRQFGVEFVTHGSATWVFVRTWKAGEFVRVAVAMIDRYYGDASSELAILGKILSAVGSGASLVCLSGGSHTLVECYKELRQWVHEDPCRLPGFRCKIAEAMPAEDCISCVRDIGPLFNDRVHCGEAEGGGASRLDAVKAVSSSGH